MPTSLLARGVLWTTALLTATGILLERLIRHLDP